MLDWNSVRTRHRQKKIKRRIMSNNSSYKELMNSFRHNNIHRLSIRLIRLRIVTWILRKKHEWLSLIIKIAKILRNNKIVVAK